jgi:tetratricopeptide (TPR) repeat protein
MNDSFGNTVTLTDGAALTHLETALDGLLHFRGAISSEINSALALEPGFALAHAFDAYLAMLTLEADGAIRARKDFSKFLGSLQTSSLTERERLHVQAADTLLDGNFLGASAILETITYEHPRDLLALAVGHHIDFFTGATRLLRDRPAATLSAWSESDANYANVLGMLAFGLEECHQHDRAFEVGLEAVERNPKDVWAMHAVGHTFEETGRFADGLKFYDDRLSDWTVGNFYNVHNWWHYALYALEAGDTTRALAVHDGVLFTAQTGNLSLQLTDASALLWRMRLEGHAELERFQILADRWRAKIEPEFHAFIDMHMVMAFVGADCEEDAERVIANRERWLETNPPETITNVHMTRAIGLPVARAILAFGRGQFERAIELLFPIRHRIHEFGGSHAQRDAVLKTLIEACLRSGQFRRAQSLISERLSVRPRSPYNWLKHAQALEGMGMHTQAQLARVTASDQRPQVH